MGEDKLFDDDIIEMCTQTVHFLPLIHDIGKKVAISKPLSLESYKIIRPENQENICEGYSATFRKNAGCYYKVEENDDCIKISYAIDKKTLDLTLEDIDL